MTWIILALLIAILIVVVLRKEWKKSELPVDPEAAMRAAVELHAIRSRLDVALTKREQRQTAVRVRREIAEALGRDGGDGS